MKHGSAGAETTFCLVRLPRFTTGLVAVEAGSFSSASGQPRRGGVNWRHGRFRPPTSTTLSDFQRLIRAMYFEKDVARGIDGTFMWLMEEVGELASALRNGSHEERLGEFADVLAWLATIANVAGVDLSEAIARKYGIVGVKIGHKQPLHRWGKSRHGRLFALFTSSQLALAVFRRSCVVGD